MDTFSTSLSNETYLNALFLKTNDVKLRLKRSNDITLVEATARGDYTYWLSQEDIADIARIAHNNFAASTGNNADFEILGSFTQLRHNVELFQLNVQAKQLNRARLTLIINLENLHWVTLMMTYQENHYAAYYIDSKNTPLPRRYYGLLYDTFHIQPLSLSPGFIQQEDNHNCGFWALQNAALLNQMVEQHKSMPWVVEQLKKSSFKTNFKENRDFFSEMLLKDENWCHRHSDYLDHLKREKISRKLSDTSAINQEPYSKKIKMDLSEQEKVNQSLEFFVEIFLSGFVKRLSLYHLLAKGESLTEEALKTELKTGITGALLGVGIALTLAGSVPSLVASIRNISNRFFFSKTKAQQITKIFSEYKPDCLRCILAEAAVTIFSSFESQFMQVTDKAGDKMAIEKLAEDAVGRLFNGITTLFGEYPAITHELIEKSILQGPSEVFFKPNIKRAQLEISGYSILSKKGDKMNTAALYEKIGLIEFYPHGPVRKFYAYKKYPSNKYGYRRLLNWEKTAQGELKYSLKIQYFEKEYFPIETKTQIISKNYFYFLDMTSNLITARHILTKIEHRHVTPHAIRKNKKTPIYFDLRKPVQNFSGRTNILEVLHSILASKMTIAIVPGYSLSSPASTDNQPSPSSTSGAQLSITGLGGIGKTQLALRYAEIYAEFYDHNVLWIDSETKENLAYSFHKLATRLNISTKDTYGLDKNLEELIETIYEYFSDGKSLFIFDNVQNYRALENYLPQSRPGNKPTVLITSRYSNWGNVAVVLPLPVFTENETIEFIRKSLQVSDVDYETIKTLNQLLHGLPLALQQAAAYIKLRSYTDPTFSISHYIELFKSKRKELLSFNFFDYSNDSYLKTVFTTWSITLDKIKTEKKGNYAIALLNIMAYLYPDHLPVAKFYYLTSIYSHLEISDIDQILHLLTSYSMISIKDTQTYLIHRLVQQILRINIESNHQLLDAVVYDTHQLLWHWSHVYKKAPDTVFHNMHFYLYMSEYPNLFPNLIAKYPEKNFFDTLALQNIQHSQYFIDLAYFNFPKNKFLVFLGKAISYYIKLGYFAHLHEIFSYLTQKWDKKILSRENIKYMTEYITHLQNPHFKLKRFSTLKEKKNNQHLSVKLYYQFISKIFGPTLSHYEDCKEHSLKRSLCSFESKAYPHKTLTSQQFKFYFKKIESLVRYVNSGLMTENILSAFIQGHFSEVAINFGLITSSTLLGKISHHVFTQGEHLAQTVSNFEDLGIDNKNTLQILFHNALFPASKKRFLGKLIQVTSPFIARGTDLYFVYTLMNEIKTYQAGDNTGFSNILSNSVILGIDGLEAGLEGAELLGIITGITAVSGPIGDGIALLIWLGAETYAGKKQIETIERYVHLSRGEKFIEFLRSFLHLSPSDYLQTKTNNQQLVEQAIQLLKHNTHIKWFIFPSFFNASTVAKNNLVFLDQKKTLIPDDTNPNNPKEGHLFCLSGFCANASEKNVIVQYSCPNALGVTSSFNRTGNLTLIDLGEGEDEVIAFSGTPTLFLVGNGTKWFQGGDNSNIFDLQGNAITGSLIGGHALDILNLADFHPKNSDFLLLDNNGFLCGKKQNSLKYIISSLQCSIDNPKVKIDNIEQILGRKNEVDIFYLNSPLQIIDGHGGKNETYPDSFFITNHSAKHLKFILRNNTRLLFSFNTTADSVDYIIPTDEIGNTWIQFSLRSRPIRSPIRHQFFFDSFLNDVTNITIHPTMRYVSVQKGHASDHIFAITLITLTDSFDSPKNNLTRETNKNLNTVFYLFNDIELQSVTAHHFTGQERMADNEPIDKKMNHYIHIANRLNKSLSIQLLNNVTISIGRKNKQDIFYINSLFENHVVSHGGENIYIILPGDGIIQPLPNITLYNISRTDAATWVELRDSLDLRELIKKYKQIYPKAIISSHVFAKNNDLILTFSDALYSPSDPDQYNSAHFCPWITILLKNARSYDTPTQYPTFDIFLDSFPRNLQPTENGKFWTLTPVPLVITQDKQIILLTHHDLLDEDSQIIILKNIGHYVFLRDQSNLILTNIPTPTFDNCTIICAQFYTSPIMKKKVLSTTFRFFDEEIRPLRYQNEIEGASFFSHFVDILSSNKSNINPDSYLHSLKPFPSAQKKEANALLTRHKRRTPFENRSLLNVSTSSVRSKPVHQNGQTDEKEHIEAIANAYLEKYDPLKNQSTWRKKKFNQKKNKQEKKNAVFNDSKHDKARKKNDFLRQSSKDTSTKPINPNEFVRRQKRSFINPQPLEPSKTSLFSQSKTMHVTKNQFNDSPSPKKRNFLHPSTLTQAETYNLSNKNKKTIIKHFPSLSYHQKQFESNKNKPSSSAYRTNAPDFHNTLVFLDFMTRKFLKNPMPQFSSDKKFNKTIQKVQRQKDKINADVFKHNNLKQ